MERLFYQTQTRVAVGTTSFSWRLWLNRAITWKWHKMDKPSQLFAKARAEVVSMSRGQCAIAQTMISARKSDDSGLACRQHRRLERRFHRFETGVAKNRFARGTGCFFCPALKG